MSYDKGFKVVFLFKVVPLHSIQRRPKLSAGWLIGEKLMIVAWILNKIKPLHGKPIQRTPLVLYSSRNIANNNVGEVPGETN